MIYVTKHAQRQYKRRIAQNEIDNKITIKLIRDIIKESKYISDNKQGILLRNEDLMIESIIKDRKVITIYPIKKKVMK